MIKKLKSNKLIVVLLLIVCAIFLFSPKTYANSCLNAISVWAFNVLPTLLPFFILTRLIVNLSSPKPNKMDKFFKKIYHTSNSSTIYFLSIISGYPMGAKLICNLFEMKRITKNEAKRMLSFCSVSGPMFIIGTVGISFLCSFKAGVIVLISNILASLVNGLIYRGKAEKELDFSCSAEPTNANLLYDCVYDSLISVLMVGGFIVMSFLFIDILENLKITTFFANLISMKTNLNADVIRSIFKGGIEITRGVLDLGKTTISLRAKTIIASGLVGFGGVSVLMQSQSFLSRLKLSAKTMLLQKFSQAILCVAFAIPLAFLI